MDRNDEQLVEGAQAVLKGNDLGGWTKPAPGLYPHQWDWDSCFIAIGIAHYDPHRAARELQSLLRGQWRNGLVPQIVFNPEGQGYFPGPDVWQSTRSPDAPRDIQTSGITQPPVLASAALRVWEIASQTDEGWATGFLQEVYPAIVRYHEFLYDERNPDGTGLVVVVHPWESGLDNSPPYLDAGSRVNMAYKPKYERLDLLHVAAKNRPTNKDYDLYVYLLEQMRNVDWDQKRYLQEAPLQVQDVIFNAVLAAADRDLARIAEIVGGDVQQAKGWHARTVEAINAQLWDEESATYYSYDRVAGRLLRDNTLGSFVTLWGDAAPEDRAQLLIARHLRNEGEFWPSPGYPVPTTALDSPWFNGENYWLGPVWISTNWLIERGLRRYGQDDLAGRIREASLDLVARSGYREYFNPRTGEGYGTDSFSWTAALTIDMIRSGASG